MEARHDPVMLTEVLELLDLQPGQWVIDGTVGLAGHALAMGARVGGTGTVVGFDWDNTMLQIAGERLATSDVPHRLFHADYRQIPAVWVAEGLPPAHGILLDLGLNSAQIDDPSRGLSFLHDAPLDLRMDRSQGEPASAFLNRATPDQIEAVLWDYGDERWARAIARKVVERRRESPIRTTFDFVDCVLAAIPTRAREKRIHPATRSFMGLRIAINRELEGLEDALVEISGVLAPGGTMVVLAYHSGEDRAVKRAFARLAAMGYAPLHKKPQSPTPAEIAANPRSRSAKLRAVRRTEDFDA